MNACRFLHGMSSLTRRVLVSAPRRASVRGANSEIVEPSKRGTRRVKSPKSKSPAPPPASTPFENEDARDAIMQLKGHEAEVREYAALNIRLLITDRLGLRLCLEPYSAQYFEFGVSSCGCADPSVVNPARMQVKGCCHPPLELAAIPRRQNQKHKTLPSNRLLVCES